MANMNSLTIGNTTLPVANSLASLSDTNITGTPADGSVLVRQSGKWAAGGKPVTFSNDLSSAEVQSLSPHAGIQLRAVKDGVVYAADFNDGGDLKLYRMDAGATTWTLTSTFTKDDDSGWLLLDSEYIRTRYRRKNGIVFLNWAGCTVIKELPANTVFGRLPEGFRPLNVQTSVFSVYPEGGAADGYLRVGIDGVLSRNASSALAVGKSFMVCFSFLVG